MEDNTRNGPVVRPARVSGDPPRSADSTHSSPVSWSAIFAGAIGAAALSLILLILGTGLGLSSVSPWASRGVSSTTFGVSTIVWISFVAVVASGTGGYLAGRLRSRWAGTHGDEVYFRDTAHGFLAWAVATLLTAGLLSSVIGSIVATGVEAGGSVVGAAGSAVTGAAGAGAAAAPGPAKSEGSAPGMSALGYFTDSMFRPNVGAASSAASSPAPGDASTAATAAEVGKIFARSMANGSMAPEDTKYIGQLVAQRTGITQQEAEKRVTDTYAKAQAAIQEAEAKARDAADKARKAAAYAALWLFISLLLGAFVASLAATFGGRRRDI